MCSISQGMHVVAFQDMQLRWSAFWLQQLKPSLQGAYSCCQAAYSLLCKPTCNVVLHALSLLCKNSHWQ